MMTEIHDNVLEIEGLKVYFDSDEGELRAVDGVTFSMARGRILAIVGESGCGKSVTAYSVLRLIQKPGRVAGGVIRLFPRNADSIDITGLNADSDKLYQVRGGLVSMVFQEPMTALSPVHTIGNQICEAILLHHDVSHEESEQRAIAMLEKVGIPSPGKRLHQYPHEMSGGMRQRVVIAMALVCNPEVLIADEPTTALDVTVQAQIIELIKSLRKAMGMSVLLITHDLGVVAQTADDVAVMYLGRIVERADVRSILKDPKHPYTMALLRSLPSLGEPGGRLPSIEGNVPALTAIPVGCPFHPRCRFVVPGECDAGGPPPLRRIENGREVACVVAEDLGQ